MVVGAQHDDSRRTRQHRPGVGAPPTPPLHVRHLPMQSANQPAAQPRRMLRGHPARRHSGIRKPGHPCAEEQFRFQRDEIHWPMLRFAGVRMQRVRREPGVRAGGDGLMSGRPSPKPLLGARPDKNWLVEIAIDPPDLTVTRLLHQFQDPDRADRVVTRLEDMRFGGAGNRVLVGLCRRKDRSGRPRNPRPAAMTYFLPASSRTA